MFNFKKNNGTLKLKLFEAVDDGDLEEFKELFYQLTSKELQKEILKNMSEAGRNLLHRSCLSGNFKIVEVILEFMTRLNLNLNEMDNRGYTAANLAMVLGYPISSVWKSEENSK
jgi:ankyrin repeat protein